MSPPERATGGDDAREPAKSLCSCIGRCSGGPVFRCREQRGEPLCEPVPEGARVFATEVFDGYEDLYVYVCPYCRRQYRGPGGHHVAGDDAATSCFHARPGERGVTQPRLVRIKVQPVDPFVPLAIPTDQAPRIAEVDDAS